MIPEIGHFLLILATASTLLCGLFLLAWERPAELYLNHYVRPLSQLSALLALAATATLIYSFLADDFSVAYVANHSNSHLAWFYKVAALWGGHEGSMLFWALGLTLVTAIVGSRPHHPHRFASRAASILALLSFGFLLFILLTSNPFDRLLPAVPVEGRNLNPMLQDIGLILHPPMVFGGYVALAVLFAGAVTALVRGYLRGTELAWLRRWNLLAWFMLTLGNLFGSWWAYNELGWGGWWFWDPVENASFIPWLLSTALLHTLYLARTQNAMLLTSVMLCLGGFIVSLVGTFLVRSGIIQSVHAFASDPQRGSGVLILLLATALPALTLLAWQAPVMRRSSPLGGQSRHRLLMVGSLLLVVAALSVLLGTCYPFIYAALDLGSISVGAPYFNTVFIPMALLCCVSMGWVILPPHTTTGLKGTLLALCAIGSALLTLYSGSDRPDWMWMGLLSASWTLVALTLSGHHHWQQSRFDLSLAPWLAHLGVALFVLGATVLTHYEEAVMVRMGPGNGRTLAGYTAVYEQTLEIRERAYQASEAVIRLDSESEQGLTYITPQRRTYLDDRSEVSIAGVYHSPLSDLYISMGPAINQEQFLVRISHKPWVRLLWLGGLLCAFGGLLAWRRSRTTHYQEYNP
ncbi:heme lyase CcmF/NrfE family subunit [Ferrimonas sediminicola]|uniref:heme lyase CcmF/NrfE family subunit n=1 Tax=Ferrimonas sediminicola TaxID=2569538 RepID=UPI00145CE8A1|nr:heme lyase NrfEFG subunit NrfE [Ferrimonas sediminicola]